MPNVRVNGISLEYEEFGEKDATPLLLIMGLGAQMVSWREAACERLAGRGFRVIRYDSRDVGLSTKFDEQCPDPGRLIPDVMEGKDVDLPYTLDDMAHDAAGLLGADERRPIEQLRLVQNAEQFGGVAEQDRARIAGDCP